MTWTLISLVVTSNCRAELLVFDASTGESLPAAQIRIGSEVYMTDQRGQVGVQGPCDTPILVEHPLYRTASTVLASERRELTVGLDPERVTEIDDVVVVAPAPRIAPMRSSTTLDESALDAVRGKNLADSLSLVPGVMTLRTSAASKPIIRGQLGRRVLIVYNGIRHESQKWALDHGPEVDPFAAGSIEVLKGANGVRYGADAIGGVVLISPPKWRERGWGGVTHQVFESNGRQGTLALRLDGAPSDDFKLRLDANIQRRAALTTPDYALENTGGSTWNIGAATELHGLELSYRHYAFENGIFVGTLNGTPDSFFAQIARERPRGADEFTSEYGFDRPFQEASHDVATARYRLGSLTLTYAFQYDRRREFDRARRAVTRPQADFTLRTHTAELVHEYESGRRRGIVGVTGWFQGNAYAGSPLIVNYRSWTGGVFAIERLRVAPFELEWGFRADGTSRRAFLSDLSFRRQLNRDRIDPDACTDTGDAQRCPSRYASISASLGGRWHASEIASIGLEMGSATRFPSIDEQYLNGTAPSFPIYALGDPDLSPETTLSGSLTANLELTWLTGEMSVYLNRIDDYIYFAPELTPDGEPAFDVLINGSFPRFSTSQIDALFWGADGAVALRPFRFPLELELGGSMVRAEEQGTGRFLVLIPSDRFRATIRYEWGEIGFLRDVVTSCSGTWVARQDRVDLNADFAEPPEGYGLLGGSVSAELPFTKIGIELRNILNTRYRDYTSLVRYFADEPGRSVVFRFQQEY